MQPAPGCSNSSQKPLCTWNLSVLINYSPVSTAVEYTVWLKIKGQQKLHYNKLFKTSMSYKLFPVVSNQNLQVSREPAASHLFNKSGQSTAWSLAINHNTGRWVAVMTNMMWSVLFGLNFIVVLPETTKCYFKNISILFAEYQGYGAMKIENWIGNYSFPDCPQIFFK